MNEHQILFTAPMVRALLDGSKTQTRRIVKPQPKLVTTQWEHAVAGSGVWMATGPSEATGGTRQTWGWALCPYGQPGDQLWVRETHRPIFGQTCGLIAVDYKADPEEKWGRMRDSMGCSKWTPSIHMRREYSRINLQIESVRVERLQDISEADARAEGARSLDVATGRETLDPNARHGSYVAHYKHIWQEINGPLSWAANPWVWVIDFKREDLSI